MDRVPLHDLLAEHFPQVIVKLPEVRTPFLAFLVKLEEALHQHWNSDFIFQGEKSSIFQQELVHLSNVVRRQPLDLIAGEKQTWDRVLHEVIDSQFVDQVLESLQVVVFLEHLLDLPLNEL